jgi:hypothetical protein
MLFAASALFLATVWTARLSDIPMMLLDDAGLFESGRVYRIAFVIWIIVPTGMYGTFVFLATVGLLYLSAGDNRR